MKLTQQMLEHIARVGWENSDDVMWKFIDATTYQILTLDFDLEVEYDKEISNTDALHILFWFVDHYNWEINLYQLYDANNKNQWNCEINFTLKQATTAAKASGRTMAEAVINAILKATNWTGLDKEKEKRALIKKIVEILANSKGEQYIIRASGLVEWVCNHGVGHPLPESSRLLYLKTDNSSWDVHGCDGCCKIKFHSNKAMPRY